MPDHELAPLVGTSHFVVLIGSRELGFAEVGRLTSETDLTVPPPEGAHRFETVVLRRALTRSSELFEWRRTIVSGKDDRRPVTISLLDSAGGRAVSSWRLEGAWPRRWSGPSLNASGNDIAMEELELAYDGLVWLDDRDPDPDLKPESDLNPDLNPDPDTSPPRPSRSGTEIEGA